VTIQIADRWQRPRWLTSSPEEDKALVKSFLGAFLFNKKVQGLRAR